MSDPKVGDFVTVNNDGRIACADGMGTGQKAEVTRLSESHVYRDYPLYELTDADGESHGLFQRYEFDFTGNDPVNHPSHYTNHPSGVEVIEITRHMNFNRGNAIKYILRADHKGNTVQDLEKAIWYLQDELKRIG